MPPLCLGTKDPEEIIMTVKNLEPCLGGINQEDIATPRCFEILERLRKQKKNQFGWKELGIKANYETTLQEYK